MNLTREVLESQASRIDKTIPGPVPLLEAQVVEVADSMTYDAHDTDDAVKLGLVTLEELAAIPLVCDTIQRVRQRFGNLHGELLRKATVHELIDRQVTDVLQTTGPALERSWLGSPDEARRAGFRIGPGATLAAQKTQLEAFLYERVYRHPQLIAMRSRAQEQLRAMFAGYCRRPALLPQKFRDRAESIGIAVAVGDYLAGMTDRYCEQQCERYFQTAKTTACAIATPRSTDSPPTSR